MLGSLKKLIFSKSQVNGVLEVHFRFGSAFVSSTILLLFCW